MRKFLFFLFFFSELFALNVEIYPEKREVLLGEKFSIKIKSTQEILFKGVEIPTTTVHIFSQKPEKNELSLEVAIYALGEVSIPFRLFFLENEKPFETLVEGVKVKVAEQISGETDEIKPMKGQLGIFEDWWILAVLLAVVIFVFFITRRKKKELPIPQEILTPREIALKKLEEIKTADFPSRGMFKEYYDAISDCLRWYITEKLSIFALQSTLKELRKNLKKVLPQETSEKVILLLEECDWIKFAPLGKIPEKVEEIFNEAYKIIENEF